MNIVFLAAGRGSRLSELTGETHKSLLPIAGRPAFQHILDTALSFKPREVVVVTGYKHEDIEAFVASNYHGAVKLAFNERYASDTNILSTDIGVDALSNPSGGYHIVETDIVMQKEGWHRLFSEQGTHSVWSTRGRYSSALTGGALKAAAGGGVEEIVYAPKYEQRFDGWSKLLGTLYVGADQVAGDRRIRKAAIERTIAQYYMTPWVDNIQSLPCRELDLSEFYAASYNDINAYRHATQKFEKMTAEYGA